MPIQRPLTVLESNGPTLKQVGNALSKLFKIIFRAT